MIVSVSRRTDIPAFYSEWFYHRLAAGYALIRNPYNAAQVKRVSLRPEDVDCFVFWSKNPRPLLAGLDQLAGYPFYFQFTLNGYGHDLEPNVPELAELVDTFQTMAGMVGKERVIWRYDPIVGSDNYSPDYHAGRFATLAEKLAPYTEKCMFSFLDFYRNTARNMKPSGVRPWSAAEMDRLAGNLAGIANVYGLSLATCSEPADYRRYGIMSGCCVDAALIARLRGDGFTAGKDPYQREACGCASSVDLGAYHSCPHLCRYCYANASGKQVETNYRRHRPDSPLLVGQEVLSSQ